MLSDFLDSLLNLPKNLEIVKVDVNRDKKIVHIYIEATVAHCDGCEKCHDQLIKEIGNGHTQKYHDLFDHRTKLHTSLSDEFKKYYLDKDKKDKAEKEKSKTEKPIECNDPQNDVEFKKFTDFIESMVNKLNKR